MTKKENAELGAIVDTINSKIQELYDGLIFQNCFRDSEERAVFIQGMSYAIEPLAEFTKKQVKNVDLNRLMNR